ncbi:O-antigen polymerase (fragment) [Verrucomicrobia bacterium]
MLLPAMLCTVWQMREAFTSGARTFLVAVIALGAMGCLYWSGSKGGWLLMIVLGLVAMLRLPLARHLRLTLITVVLAMGLAGFFFKYAAFFKKGATSVGARFDYWRAAAQIAREHPLLGTGPGTFFIPYLKIKEPKSEPARLVHNDYLEQASDSGVIGAAAYLAFIGAGLVWSGRRIGRMRKKPAGTSAQPTDNREKTGGTDEWEVFAVWLGLLGWSLQGLFEFGLYIPALAWPAFAFLGWLLGRGSTDM